VTTTDWFLRRSERENRHLGEEIDAAGGVCLLDMRVRPGGSHHQKFVVLRHPGRPEQDCAFVGGIDLCHSRRDDDGRTPRPCRYLWSMTPTSRIPGPLLRPSPRRLALSMSGTPRTSRVPARPGNCAATRPRSSRFDRTWSRPLYHAVYDPDGRPRSQRGGDRF
jgi:hypothetical protein